MHMHMHNKNIKHKEGSNFAICDNMDGSGMY